MRKEYDLKSLKVKRRGLPPALTKAGDTSAKVRITISLDQDVVDHFKSEAAKLGGLPYQTQINQALRVFMARSDEPQDAQALKDSLLEDADFLKRLAQKLDAA